jgi:hypothetical protein
MVGPNCRCPQTHKEDLLMNAALLVISSALATGGDITPAGAWGEGPIIVQAGGGCSGCGPTTASSCGCKPSLLDKIKAHLTPKPSCGCAPAPTCKTCEPACPRPNLLDKIKASCCKKPSCGCGPVASPCATIAPVAPVTPPTTIPPKDMPKLKEVHKSDAPKTSGNTGIAPIPSVPTVPPIAPNPAGLPTIPAAPISTGNAPNGPSPY